MGFAQIDGISTLLDVDVEGVAADDQRIITEITLLGINTREAAAGLAIVLDTVVQNLGTHFVQTIDRLRTLVAQDIVLDASATLLGQNHRAGACQAHTYVASLYQTVPHGEVVIVLISLASGVCVDEVDVVAVRSCSGSMHIATVYGHVLTDVLQMNHAGEEHVLSGQFEPSQRNPVGTGDGEHTILSKHLVIAVGRFAVLLIAYLHVVPVAALALDGHCIGRRSTLDGRHIHEFLVDTTLYVDGHRTVDTVLKRIHSTLDSAIVGPCTHSDSAVETALDLSGSGCRSFHSHLLAISHNGCKRCAHACIDLGSRLDIVGQPELIHSALGHTVAAMYGVGSLGQFSEELLGGKGAHCICGKHLGASHLGSVGSLQSKCGDVQLVEIAIHLHIHAHHLDILFALHHALGSNGLCGNRCDVERLLLIGCHLDGKALARHLRHKAHGEFAVL